MNGLFCGKLAVALGRLGSLGGQSGAPDFEMRRIISGNEVSRKRRCKEIVMCRPLRVGPGGGKLVPGGPR